MERCDGCGKKRSSLRSMGRDSNGDPDAPDLCFVCVHEAKKGRVWNNTYQGYLPDQIGPDDIENKEGLTLQQWLDAAFFGTPCGTSAYILLSDEEKQALVDAWSAGEDPTEYAGTR